MWDIYMYSSLLIDLNRLFSWKKGKRTPLYPPHMLVPIPKEEQKYTAAYGWELVPGVACCETCGLHFSENEQPKTSKCMVACYRNCHNWPGNFI